MPCTSELAQLPTPAMARRMVLIGIPSCGATTRGRASGEVERVDLRGARLAGGAAFVRDQPVEPGEVGGERSGVALDQRPEIGVDAPVGLLGPAPVVGPPGQLRSAAFEQRDAL